MIIRSDMLMKRLRLHLTPSPFYGEGGLSPPLHSVERGSGGEVVALLEADE